jgi:hypothetical protein
VFWYFPIIPHLRNAIFVDDRFNRRNDGGDDKSWNRRNGRPKKVFWYFPIIPHLMHWFANKKES